MSERLASFDGQIIARLVRAAARYWLKRPIQASAASEVTDSFGTLAITPHYDSTGVE